MVADDEVEIIPITREQRQRLAELAVMRVRFEHSPGCRCRTCSTAIAAWAGNLDLADAFIARLSAVEVEALITNGTVTPPPPPAVVTAVCAFLRWAGSSCTAHHPDAAHITCTLPGGHKGEHAGQRRDGDIAWWRS